MALRAGLTIQGDFARMIRDESEALTRARGRAIVDTTKLLLEGYRQAVRSGTPGRRLSSAVRSRTYRDGAEVEAGIVFSKARKRTESGEVIDLVELLGRGETVRPKRGRFLLIPNPGFARTRSGGYSRRGLNRTRATLRQFVSDPEAAKDIYVQPISGGRALIVQKKKRGNRSTILGVLVRSVTIPKQYDLQGVFRDVERSFPQRLADYWTQELSR